MTSTGRAVISDPYLHHLLRQTSGDETYTIPSSWDHMPPEALAPNNQLDMLPSKARDTYSFASVVYIVCCAVSWFCLFFTHLNEDLRGLVPIRFSLQGCHAYH